MFKQTTVSLSLASGLFVACTASAIAFNGTVKFQGEIADAACTVDVGASNTMLVNLGKVSKTAFNGVGSASNFQKFTLKLKDCPSTITSTSVTFDGTAYVGDDSILALTEEAGVATGVGIQLSDSFQTPIKLSNPSAKYVLKPNVVNDLDFFARYIAKADVIEPGPANASATFTMNYN